MRTREDRGPEMASDNQTATERVASVSQHTDASQLARHIVRLFPATAILLVSLTLTVWAWQIALRRSTEQDEARFSKSVEQTTLALINRLFQYEAALRGLCGLFMASDNVNEAEWDTYLDHLAVERTYPAIRRVFYVRFVEQDYVARFFDDIGPPAAHPLSYRDTYFLVRYANPHDERAQWLGYDLGANAAVREALMYARDTDLPTLSARTTFRADGTNCSVVFCLPVYRFDGPKSFMVEDRRKAIQGWIAATLDVTPMLNDVIGKQTDAVHVSVYDGDDLTDETCLHRCTHPVPEAQCRSTRALSRTTSFDFGTRTWTLRFRADPQFLANSDTLTPRLVLGTGVVTCLLLFGVVWLLTARRAQALALAGRMTSALRESEAWARKLALVAERTNKMAVITNAMGHIEWVNEGFERMTEYARADVVGKSVEQMTRLLGLDKASIRQVTDNIRGARPFETEAVYTAKSGREFWAATSIQPVRDENGQAHHFIIIASDITERKQAEQERAELLLRYQVLLENTPAAIFLKDREGRYTAVNRAALDFMPPGVTDPTGLRDRDIYSRRMCEIFEAEDRLILQEGRTIRKRDRLRLRDERFAEMDVTLAPVRDEHDRIVAMVGLAADITELRRAEKELRAAKEAAEAANSAKSDFVANMSH